MGFSCCYGCNFYKYVLSCLIINESGADLRGDNDMKEGHQHFSTGCLTRMAPP